MLRLKIMERLQYGNIDKKINSIMNQETFDSVRTELEDRFGKLNEDMIIYMYEEWFEKIAKKLGI